MENHEWPAPGEHLFGQWMVATGVKLGAVPTERRVCVHPLCNEVETREIRA